MAYGDKCFKQDIELGNEQKMALTASWMNYALDVKNVKYQPSGAGGTRSTPATPAKSKMTNRVWKGVYP